ncbi:MAG: bifunctional ornithine acetyltransferase/N-acetylglutamate synthase [Ruminococcus sp.]|jgi:glutamate N-acetyltransferase/amino-acid N-acetyltransferase|nr:bifunctional ornithine acetyltransferase/N-acetylglutamate synthase [Ruminococcus sp.]
MSEIEFIEVPGGVCAPKGFKSAGVYAGVKENPKKKPDLGLLVCDVAAVTAAVFTANKVKAAPIYVSKIHLEQSENRIRAAVANSGNANACTADGNINAERMTAAAAKAIGCTNEEIICASTGVIGKSLNINAIEAAMPAAAKCLTDDGESFAVSVMTTDTFRKEYALEFTLGGKTCRIGGCAKGSGMIAPNMATTLNFLTTDAAVSQKLLQKALSEVSENTWNCLYIDGDMSTNDCAFLMASGLAGNEEISDVGDDYGIFAAALYIVCETLVKMLARDGEGATKLLRCTVEGASDMSAAKAVSRAVIGSDLLKCAMYGCDANWGRVICAAGYSGADIDPLKIDITFISDSGEIDVCKNGCALDFSEDLAKKILSEDEIIIAVNLNSGSFGATAWGCDLTYDYVKINGDYRT